MNRVYKEKRRRFTGQQPETKSASRPAVKQRMNRSPTAGQLRILFPHSVYIGFCLFVLLGRRSGNMFSMLRRVRGRIVFWADCSIGVES